MDVLTGDPSMSHSRSMQVDGRVLLGPRAGKVQQKNTDLDKSTRNWCGWWWGVLDSSGMLVQRKTQNISALCF